ncbi:hypothetical protein SAMN06309944_0989 [Micrococcales bacterium KH10]|nr:hypothetical protein SAMN06309944_0989 [Micrococcales bacterium KH10]
MRNRLRAGHPIIDVEVFGNEHFAPLEKIYAERGSLFDMTPTDADTEYWVRLMSMEAAQRTLGRLAQRGVRGIRCWIT